MKTLKCKVGSYVEWYSAPGNIWQILQLNHSNVTKCKLIISKSNPESIGEISNNTWSYPSKVYTDKEMLRLKLEWL